ncbi:universal stress protein [Streptomyces lunaelactis]|uniref:Universal stress protein n=1 Tax=Streptomyces lunaelactis TaxID=1535768 RepID=A0A2R4TC62_9ACTN|nr:universal stress protein [Streptomyces lunaelactis]AVZ76708.1 universal stress protein [Streptomyces lunaelactis]NUK87863.1 universal stress protein [Streptomyces lunaelactis]
MNQSTYECLIVGVDGSAASLAALRWSAAQARLLRTHVVAVHAWLPTGARRAPYAPAAELPTPEQDRRRAAERLHGMVSRLLELDPEAQVRTLLDQGSPVPVLLRHARHALLLALGRGPRVDITLPALGSVARDCVRCAKCPVVTVPESPSELTACPVPLGEDSAVRLEQA